MRFDSHQLVASITKESFFEFLKEFWSTIIPESFVSNWHIEFLCNELQIVAERVFRGERKLYDLVVNVPPASTKSTVVSQMFPAWCWTRMPTARFVCASYAEVLAFRDAIKTRDIIQSEKYQKCFPGTGLRQDQNTKGLFVNTSKGDRFSTGVGGTITGFHGHFQIVDDPLNPEEACSEVQLKTVNRWMSTTLPSRTVNREVTPLILVQQRLHQNDPSGNLIDEHAATIRHICLPGELTADVSPPEIASKYVDGLLDPHRLPRHALDEWRLRLGEYGYASQILQTPVPLGGGMIKTGCLQMRQDVERRLIRVVRSWDKAGTESGGCWSAGVKLGIDNKGFYWIIDVVRGQWGATKREEMIKTVAEDDGHDVEIVLEIEGGSGGKESGEATVRNLAGYSIHTYHPTGDKEARAYPFANQVGSNNVYCLIRPWNKDYIEELKFFPHARYSDQVDATSGGFNRLTRRKVKIGAMGGGKLQETRKTRAVYAGSR